MKRLIENGLFGAGLVLVKTPGMIARYNDCLKSLDIEPTALQEFSVDGMGWSPEIAQEKDDNFYLSHGIANQLAIIISPDQNNKPIHFPFTSFDRRMMQAYFKRFEAEIADLTASGCVWLDIDQEMVEYGNPSDLLLVDYIVIRSDAGKLMKAAEQQKELVNCFNSEDNAWLSPHVRAELMKSASEVGDLRFRRIDIPDMQFDDMNSFYTMAFGGMFVFRDLGDDNHSLLVMEDQVEAKKIKKSSGTRVCLLYDARSRTIGRLISEGLIDIDLEWYSNNPDELKRKRGALVLNAICNGYPDIDYCAVNSAKRKNLIIQLGKGMPKVFFELEKLIKKLRTGQIPNLRNLSVKLKSILMHPAPNLSDSEREVVWQMICKISPLEILRLYISDKDLFFRKYQTWPESKKAWVVNFLKNHYQPEMENE